MTHECDCIAPCVQVLYHPVHRYNDRPCPAAYPMLRSSITHDFDLRYHFCKWLTVQAKYRLQPCTFASITELREGPLENGTTGHYAAATMTASNNPSSADPCFRPSKKINHDSAPPQPIVTSLLPRRPKIKAKQTDPIPAVRICIISPWFMLPPLPSKTWPR